MSNDKEFWQEIVRHLKGILEAICKHKLKGQ